MYNKHLANNTYIYLPGIFPGMDLGATSWGGGGGGGGAHPKKVRARRAHNFSTTQKKALRARNFSTTPKKACSSVQYLACIIV